MKIFISWSGKYTQDVAEVLRDWFKRTLQGIDAIFYSPDIEKGKKGLQEISSALADSTVGIICLSRNNINSPWINFEAGALSNIAQSNVYTLLLGMRVSDIEPSSPLKDFQHTLFEKEDFYKLVKSVNAKIDRPLQSDELREVFETWWPKLHEAIEKISTEQSIQPPSLIYNQEKQSQVLEEILTISRQLMPQQASRSVESELWSLRHQYEYESKRYMKMDATLLSYLLYITKPATEAEIQEWVAGASTRGESHNISSIGRVRFADKDFILPVMHGSESLIIIVAPGVQVFRGDMGHSTLLFMDGFRKEGI